MRNKALAAAALLAALACGRRAQQSAQTEPPAPPLDAPANMVASRLLRGTTGYTNEMQAQYIQDQAAALGIQRFAPTDRSASESAVAPLAITYAEGMARTKEMERELANERRAIDRNKPKSVDLPGNTPRLLSTPAGSGDAGTSSSGAPQDPR